MILVSACLLGQNVKYNGGNNACELLQVYEGQGHFVPICPEGLPPCRYRVRRWKSSRAQVRTCSQAGFAPWIGRAGT